MRSAYNLHPSCSGEALRADIMRMTHGLDLSSSPVLVAAKRKGRAVDTNGLRPHSPASWPLSVCPPFCQIATHPGRNSDVRRTKVS